MLILRTTSTSEWEETAVRIILVRRNWAVMLETMCQDLGRKQGKSEGEDGTYQEQVKEVHNIF